ncbi:MAG: hypothetical protein IT163_09950 [Bryobacterales bacterium]|nr:hypothetical protein [Bryobacterales bacterium]
MDSAWWRIGALSLLFGGVEMWRVTRRRRRQGEGTWALWAITASLVALWAAGGLLAASRGRGAQPGWETVCPSGCGADGLRRAQTESPGKTVRDRAGWLHMTAASCGLCDPALPGSLARLFPG